MFDPDLNKNYTDRAEKPVNFGLTLAGMLLVLAFLLRQYWVAFVLFDTAIIIAVISLVCPARLFTMQQFFIWLGRQMGRWVSPIVMSVLYFGILTPLAIFRKLLSPKKDRVDSYFHHSNNEHREADFFERPY